MHLNWDHIRTFHAVASHGSLLAAARALRLTQPTVGRHIDLLENALGFALFTRGRDGMRLTDKGADLVSTAQDMMGRATDFERLATGLEDRVAGQVRITANEIVGSMLLPGLVADFMRLHPMIEMEIEVSNTVTNLLQRDADIAIRMFRPTQNDLVARKIRDIPMGLFAHESYLENNEAPKTISDLEEHVLVGQDRNPSLIEAYSAAGLRFHPNNFHFRSDSNIATINAVRAGIGIGPLHLEMAMSWPGLVRVVPDCPVPSLELWLACHADIRHNKRTRLVMNYLAQRLKSPYTALL